MNNTNPTDCAIQLLAEALAELAFDLNERAMGYHKFLKAFRQAAPYVNQLTSQNLCEADWKIVEAAYHRHVSELLVTGVSVQPLIQPRQETAVSDIPSNF